MLSLRISAVAGRRHAWVEDTPLVAVILGIVTGVLLLPFSRIDYDRLHDGWMLSSAVAVHAGLNVHSDVFNHFGPVNPWIQDVFLYLPVSPALTLRWVTVLSISLTVFLMAEMGRRRPSGSPVTQQAGVLAAVSWVVLSDVWGAGPMRPWPVFTLNLLVVLAAYLSLRAWGAADRSRFGLCRALLFAAGLALGIALFTRVASGLLVLAALMVCALGLPLVRPAMRALILWVLPGLLAGAGIVLARVLASGSWDEFYQNTLVFPFEFFEPEPLAPLRFLGVVAPVFGPPTLLGLVCLLYIRRNGALSSRQRSALALGAGLLMLGMTYILARSPLGSPDIAGYFAGGRALLLFLMCVMVAVVCTLVWVAVMVVTQKGRSASTFVWLLLAVFSAALLGEIVPDYTLRHIWWSLPLGLLLLFAAIPHLSGSDRLRDNPLMTPLAAVAAYSVYIGMLSLSLVRVPAPSDSVASGMFVTPQLARELSEDTRLLRETLGSRDAVFLTVEGDVATLLGNYSSADPFFTCYGAPEDLSARLSGVSALVVEPSAQPCPAVDDEWLFSMGFLPAGRNERLVIFTKGGLEAGSGSS